MPDSPLYPLLVTPYLRPMPWGGQRLRPWLTVPFPNEPIGEAWLLSDHTLHNSRVVNGPLTGTTLRQLMETRCTELLGRAMPRFPLLIKLLDARENLSVQVHPDDETSKRWAPREGGKTEAWLVLEADPDAAIYLGLKPGLDRDRLPSLLASPDAPQCLERHHPKPGDCYFVPAGIIHALGGGLVVLEVQQTSDATFRLYDWGRVDAAGKPRAVHLEAGLACVKETLPNAGLQKPRPLAQGGELLASCPYFGMERWQLSAPIERRGPFLWIGLCGTARLTAGTDHVEVPRGGLALMPAAVGVCTVEPLGSCTGALVTLGDVATSS